MSATRIYVITDRRTDAQRLVRAVNQSTAIRHCARDTFGAAVAAQDTLVDLVTAGVKVEDAGSEPEATEAA